MSIANNNIKTDNNDVKYTRVVVILAYKPITGYDDT